MAGDVEVVFDMSELNRAIRRYENKTKNLPLDLLGQLVLNETDEMFQTEGAVGSEGGWSPLKPSTIVRNPRRAGGQILQATGATANIQIDEASNYTLKFSSPTGYSGFHTEGTEHMVSRDFFALNFPKVLDAMGDLALQEYQR